MCAGHIPTPVSEAIGAILKNIDRNTPYGVFGSYGWSGEAVPAMSESLKDGGFLNQAFDPVRLARLIVVLIFFCVVRLVSVHCAIRAPSDREYDPVPT